MGVRSCWVIFLLQCPALLQLWHAMISTSIFPALQKAHEHRLHIIIQKTLVLISEQHWNTSDYIAFVKSFQGISLQEGHDPHSGSCLEGSQGWEKTFHCQHFINKIAALGNIPIWTNALGNAIAFTSSKCTVSHDKPWWQICVPKYFISLSEAVYILKH